MREKGTQSRIRPLGHWASRAVLAAVHAALQCSAHPTKDTCSTSQLTAGQCPQAHLLSLTGLIHPHPTTAQLKAFPAFSSCQPNPILACAMCPWSCSPLNLIPRGTDLCLAYCSFSITVFSKDCFEENICILAKRLQLGRQFQCVFRSGKSFKSLWNLLLESSKVFSFTETYIHHCSLRVEVSLCKRPLKCKNRTRPSLCCTSGYVQGHYWSQKLHIRGS